MCKPVSVACEGSWDHSGGITDLQGVTKHHVSRTGLESRIIEGENPVSENVMTPEWHPSTAGPEKSRGNLRGPSRKAKYSLVTDSGTVP